MRKRKITIRKKYKMNQNPKSCLQRLRSSSVYIIYVEKKTHKNEGHFFFQIQLIFCGYFKFESEFVVPNGSNCVVVNDRSQCLV